MRPDAVVDTVLARVVRRTWMAHALGAAAAGSLCGALLAAVLLRQGTPDATLMGVVAAAIVASVWMWRGRRGRTRVSAAAVVERAHPEFRNLVVTAEELLAHPDRASTRMRDRVLMDAAARIGGIRISDVVSIGRRAALCAGAAALWLAVPFGLAPVAPGAGRFDVNPTTTGKADGELRRRVVAELRPPRYIGVGSSELVNPERIDAVEGTSLRLRVAGGASRIRFGSSVLAGRQEGDVLIAETTLTESGYLAVEPGGPLVPVTVTPDRAPAITVDAPGRDLLLPASVDGIPVSASATDDFGLESLEIRYTKVSGTGEQFEFEEGTLPLALSRSTEREWQGRARLALNALKLGPGDALVYRAVGRDRRQGDAGLASSDTFFVEILGPGQVALEGVEMPPEQERYALSQQMVVLKIQRLRARERSMNRAALEEEAAAIAAEQRAVRANFIFLMGGHVEDEFEEAEQSHEIQEGRLENNARKDISAAIHQMSLSEQGLTAVDTGRALPPAKAAVEALQRAFGRNRYILRSLAARSRIDPSRRLTGELDAAADWRRKLTPVVVDRTMRESRALMVELLDIAAAIHARGQVPDQRFTRLAEQALAVEPAAAEWQDVAAKLIRLRDAVAEKRPASEVKARMNDAIAPVLAAAGRNARRGQDAATLPATRLFSAWAEEARR
jgi:hypothetical protein